MNVARALVEEGVMEEGNRNVLSHLLLFVKQATLNI